MRNEKGFAMKRFLVVILLALFLVFTLASISRAMEQRILTVNCLDKWDVMRNIRAVEGRLRLVAIDSYGRGVLVYMAESGMFTIGFVPAERSDLICPIFWGEESAIVDEIGEER